MSDQLTEIERRVSAATKGPWRHERDRLGVPAIVTDAGDNFVADCLSDNFELDAAFLAHARSDVPFLLARVRELETALRRIASDEPFRVTGKHAQSLARAALASVPEPAKEGR